MAGHLRNCGPLSTQVFGEHGSTTRGMHRYVSSPLPRPPRGSTSGPENRCRVWRTRALSQRTMSRCVFSVLTLLLCGAGIAGTSTSHHAHSGALGTHTGPGAHGSSVATSVCDASGLAETPRVCRRGDAHLPNIYGGPSTLDQCSFGSTTPGNSPEWGGASCWSGSLFGFSGPSVRMRPTERIPPLRDALICTLAHVCDTRARMQISSDVSRAHTCTPTLQHTHTH
jgi:hypothetical protein